MTTNLIRSPRSSHRNPSRSSTHHSNGLQLLDVNHLPIAYSSRSPSLQPRTSLERRRAHADENYVEEVDDDDDDEWELEHDYINIEAADAALHGMDPYLGAPSRPRMIQRDSQDVEFGNRLTPTRRMRGHGRGWEVNVRMPHIKGLSRGKTALLRTIRGGLRRAHTAGHTPSNGSPPFEFRDPQPAPQSIRQQYAELAPSDTSAPPAVPEKDPVMRIENGLLAPPAPSNGPNLATAEPRLSMATQDLGRRSRTVSRYSQALSQIQSHRPRTHSDGGSRHDTRGAELREQGEVIAPHSRHAHDNGEGDEDGTAETTLVQHDQFVNNLHPALEATPRSKYNHYDYKPTLKTPRRSNTISFVDELRLPGPRALARSRSQNTRKSSKPTAPLVRALQAFQKLPWVAHPEYPPGALMPTESPPRVAKDFVPSRSARARLRDRKPESGILVTKKGSEVDLNDENPSWYLPGPRDVQRTVRSQHRQKARALAAGMSRLNITKGGPMRQAVASYRAANGRPLGYMYASPPSRSVSTDPVSSPLYTGSARSGSIAAAASAYLTRSVSASQASGSASGNGSMYSPTRGILPPVAPKTRTAQPATNTQGQPGATQQQEPSNSYTNGQPVQFYTYNFAYPQVQPSTRTRVPGSSPALPALPAASYAHTYVPSHSAQSIPTIPTNLGQSTDTSSSSYASIAWPERDYSGSSTSSFGTVQQVPMRYVNYGYSYN